MKKDVIEITSETELPVALENTEWIEDAKDLNGACLSLISYTQDGTIAFKYQGVTYFVTRNSFGMDHDAFESNAFLIEEDLSNAGCEMI